MTAPILTAAFFLVATTGVHLASLAVAALRLRRAPPGDARGFADLPPVSLVRPLCCIDNFATNTLRSTFELNLRIAKSCSASRPQRTPSSR